LFERCSHLDAQSLKSKANQHDLILLKRLPKEMLHSGRGRPHGQRQPIIELTNRWYLIWISKQHGLETREFLACFLDAWIHEKSSCEGISIQCRQKTKNNGVFLVTQDQKVIAQLSLSETALKRLPDVDLASFPWNEPTLVKKIENLRAVDMRIRDVDVRVKWVNLKARVVEKSPTRKVYSRLGIPHVLSTATISDNTGSIKLPLWNTQIDTVSVGDTVRIENGRVRTFRGELQVSVEKNGKLNVIENQSSTRRSSYFRQ